MDNSIFNLNSTPSKNLSGTPYWLQVLMLLVFVFVGTAVSSLLGIAAARWLFGAKDLTLLQDMLSNNPGALLTHLNYLKAVLFMQLLTSIGTFGLPALLFAIVYGGIKNDYLHVKSRVPLWGILSGVLIIITVSPLISWAGELNQRLWLPHFLKGVENWMQQSEAAADKLTNAITQMHTIEDLLINLVIIGVAAGVCEELFFRGCVQNIIQRATGRVHLAVWLAAIIFSAIHMQFYGFVPRMLLGVMLGYMYVWSGSLWVNISMHIFNNSIQILLLYLFQHKTISYNIDDDKAPSFYMAVVSTLITISIMLYTRQRGMKSTGEPLRF